MRARRLATRTIGVCLLAGSLLGARVAKATVNCIYAGTGCNAGYSATASFTCTSTSLLKIVVTNTSTINDSGDPSNNILTSLTFAGATPVNSPGNQSALVATGSTLLPVGLTDCSSVLNGPDVTCEWAAGSNFCPDCAAGSDPSCPTPISECGLSFVSSRQSSDVVCDPTNNFVLAPGSIDMSTDGPDFGTINAPTQTRGGNEAIDDTVEVIVAVGTCAETTAFCSGVATYGSHFRHTNPGTPSTPTSTTTTASPSTSTSSSTSTSTTTPTNTTTTASTTTTTETTTTTREGATSSTTTSTTTTTTPVCGNGMLDPGEQCDPPGPNSAQCADPSSPGGAFLLCNADCTCCIPQTEICGNLTDDDCDGLIDCVDPDCAGTPPCIRRDPSRIRFNVRPVRLDLFTSHGKVGVQQSVEVATQEIGWVLSNSRGLIYRGRLQPGDLASKVNSKVLRFKDPAARLGQGQHDGIYKAKVTVGHRGTIAYHVKAYANLSAATDAEMALHFYIGHGLQGQAWGTSGKWRRTSRGWVAGRAELLGFLE